MRASLRVDLAHPNDVDALWPRLLPGFTKACAVRPDYSPGQIFQMARSGGAFLFVAHDGVTIFAASVWQFRSDGERHSFHCLALYGDNLRVWLKAKASTITNFARENGAAVMTFCGRSGWARLFKAVRNGEYYEVAIDGR